MKIRVEYSEEPSDLSVGMVLNHPKARRDASERFIVDTGAQFSAISMLTAKSMQIKKSFLKQQKESAAGIKGEQIIMYVVDGFDYRIKDEDNYYEGKHTFRVNPDSRENILGMDFLEANNLTLEVDSKNKKAKLVRED